MKKILLVAILSVSLIFTACSHTGNQAAVPSNKTIPQKSEKPRPFPAYDSNSNESFQIDLRGRNLTSYDLSEYANDLMYADFDTATKWPDKLPAAFDYKRIMELGKNPGLNIRELHKRNITGKGIGIAIIDQKLLLSHVEYKDRLKLYEENNINYKEPQMHGPAVASIAVGKTVGVAPEADLYYIAENHMTDNGEEMDFTVTAKSIDRVLEINKKLPKDKKIRVISISVGWSPEQKGYKEVMEAVKRANKQGIFVVSTALDETDGYNFLGLGRDSLKDPDKAASYGPGIFWEKNFIKNYNNSKSTINNFVMAPMDSRTTASQEGDNDYVFYRTGGFSWTVPYLAGLYALTCQVKPDITYEVFWAKALETGDGIIYTKDNKQYDLGKRGKLVNPVRLIEAIEKLK